MAELTREQIEAWREWLAANVMSPNTELDAIFDLALRAIDSGQREARLVEALRRLLDALVQHPSKDLHPAVDNAREALREYESPPTLRHGNGR